jgi:hypothetical protein
VTRRRIQPKAAVELETVSLRLPVELVRAVEQYAKYLGGSTDRTHVITQVIEIALEQDKGFQKASRPGRPPRRPAPSAPPRSRRADPPAEQRHRRRGAIRPAGVVP